MSYFGFLFTFIIPPIVVLWLFSRHDPKAGRKMPGSLTAWPPMLVMIGHIIVAVLYTTPWDNYLVATRVWWYDPKLVTGLLIGWVPIEEYTFFVLQTILTSLWIWFLAHRLQPTISSSRQAQTVRWTTFVIFAVLWLVSLFLWLSHWNHVQYLAITLSWALPPILLQIGFGGDLLWKHRWLVFWGIALPTLYLSMVDALAIDAGTWTIAPDQSTNIMLGTLPLEEAVFFLVTNVLIVLGTILVLEKESQSRAPAAIINLLQRFTQQSNSTVALPNSSIPPR